MLCCGRLLLSLGPALRAARQPRSLPSHKLLGRTEADLPGGEKGPGRSEAPSVPHNSFSSPNSLAGVSVVVELSILEIRLMERSEILSARSSPQRKDVMSCLMQLEHTGLAAAGKDCSAKQHLGFKCAFKLLPIG